MTPRRPPRPAPDRPTLSEHHPSTPSEPHRPTLSEHHPPTLSEPVEERSTTWIPWLCLVLGAALQPFAQLQTVLPIAAWLAPVLLLRFTRTVRPIVAIPLVAVASYGAAVIALRDVFPWSAVFLLGLSGAIAALPYVLDRLIARRLPVLASTLVFPAATVGFDWLLSLTGLGTLASVANSQTGLLSLGQLSAVTGIWGITFLITWFAPVINSAWEHGFNLSVARRTIAPALVVLVVVVTAGGVRLAFSSPPASTVRVAGLAADRALTDARNAPTVQEIAAGSASTRAAARSELAPVTEELFVRTESAAREGAQIVAWAEAAGFVLKEDEGDVIDRARRIAVEQGIYLQVAIVSVLDTDSFPYAENRAIMVDPQGEVVWNYLKTVHPFGDNAVFEPGPGDVPTVSTPYGTLSTIICYDADYPALVRQAGRSGVDILLVPSNDWQPIDGMHAQASIFRAVENGVNLVRPTGSGVSLAVDHLGRDLARSNYFQTEQVTMVADVPTRGVTTLYPVIGDIVAYSSWALLAILTMASLIRRRDKVHHDQENDLDRSHAHELVGDRV